MRTAILLLVLTVAQMFLQGCASDPATTQPVPPVKTIVAGTDDLVFALVPGKCVDRQCAAVIQLRSSRKLLDSADLVFAASDAGLRKAEGDSQIGPGIDLDAWTAGTEDGTVTTAVQGVRLTERRVGLLVHQVGGFEHLKRRRDLFVAENGKLKKVWSVQEGAGPVRSAAYVVPAESGRHQDILYIEGFAPGGDEADSLEAQRLVWDESPQTMRVRLVARLPAVVVGEFPTVPAARATASGSCIAEYWVLPAGGFGGSGSSFVLALVVADRQTAEAEMARKCDVVPPRRIAEFHPIEDMK